MRVTAIGFICLLVACASIHSPSFLREGYNSSTMQGVTFKIEQWHLPRGMNSIDCEVNAVGEGINVKKVTMGYQFGVAICGPNEKQHLSVFQRYAQENQIDYGVLVGENLLSGCRMQYTFQLDCKSSDAARHFSRLSASVFAVPPSELVIWRYSQ